MKAPRHVNAAREVARVVGLAQRCAEPETLGAGCRHPYPPGGPTHRCPYCFGELDLPAVRRTP